MPRYGTDRKLGGCQDVGTVRRSETTDTQPQKDAEIAEAKRGAMLRPSGGYLGQQPLFASVCSATPAAITSFKSSTRIGSHLRSSTALRSGDIK